MSEYGTKPETGEKLNSDFIKAMSEFEMSEDGVKKLIDALNVSADVKSLLFSFSKATIKVGKYVLKIGRKIIDFVCMLFKEYPSVTFGMIFGAIAGFLVASIPIIGTVLGPIFTPIAVALGLVTGMYNDIKDKNLARRVAEINASFSPLKAQ